MHGRETIPWVLFTDLDGTLLDHATYRWTRARGALAILRRRAYPLVIVTSKTRAEVMPLLRQLGRKDPFVVENGGAIYFPAGYFGFRIRGSVPAARGWRRYALGTPRDRLVRALAGAARDARLRVRGFFQMSPREVARRAGMEMASARRAQQREFDEPFLILDDGTTAWRKLCREIGRRGLVATRGSRFFHILGKNDKGAAVRLLLEWFRRMKGPEVRAVGLGDSPNDIALLRAVDVPILVARPGGHYDKETLTAVPRTRRAGGIGPDGWNRAVRKLFGREGRRG
jgi:mannosyl-3-phosphoglycerate phosphatase